MLINKTAVGTTPLPCSIRALTAKETNYDEKPGTPKRNVEEIALIDIDHPAFSMHKDDFIKHESIQISADCKQCTITLIIGEIVPFDEISSDDTIDANPVFPFLIDTKNPTNIQCYLETLLYDEGETTYTLTVTNVHYHFNLSLTDEWKGDNSPYANYTFAFTAYVAEMIV
ncbi:unnamed protein product, partial [Mesorhabditis belari]|uniref:Uncharacterized protein n=1 Tax=Mesorhabditis belari TaxID=2138241 RepID=A0AAF3FCK3_9BILA